ncbi:MAG: hypothetical protein BGN86_02440 [Caulobacterales bacterium 68-7]|nr:MAG: hypothetical protein BGN86_02440 [Caulobacterales bacterium 68-7]
MSARLVKVAVLGNCQARSLAAALEAHAEVETTTVTWAAVADETEAAQLLERLAAFDVVISQPYKRFQALRPKIIARQPTRSAFYPRFYFSGLHPDALMLSPDHPLEFRFGGWHSTIALAAFHRGLSARDAADLYNAYIYGVLGYFRRYGEAEALQVEAALDVGLDLRADLAAWRGQVFAHTPNHPNMIVAEAMAGRLIQRLSLARRQPKAKATDPLADGFAFPVYPEIGRRIGIVGEMAFRTGRREPPIGLEQMLDEAFKAYGRNAAAVAELPEVTRTVEALRREGV